MVGQGNGLVPPFSVLWGSIVASTWAFKNSFGCAEAAACGREGAPGCSWTSPSHQSGRAARGGDGKRGPGWAGCVCACL